MGKIRLIWGVYVFIAIAIATIVFPSFAGAQANRSKESYNWSSYNAINAAHGGYADLNETPTGTVFTQSSENPLQYTATVSNDECESTFTLTIDAENASSATLSGSGTCPTGGMDSQIRINNTQRAFAIAQDEEAELERRYHTKECGTTEPDLREECREIAEQTIREAKATCMAANNYREHITRADAYLTCLAEALDVERPAQDSEDKSAPPQEPAECQIPDPGWAICQMGEFIAGITDYTFELLTPFLVVEPLNEEVSPGEESATYEAWQNIRDIANVLLAIGFIVIIFSQLTGIGLQAYHVKKGLPRLIVAALLINISFFICALLVDISNIAGRTAQDVTRYFSSNVVSQSSIFTDWRSTTDRIMRISPTDANFNQQATGVDPNATEEEAEDGEEPDEEAPEETTEATDPDAFVDEDEDTTMIINGITITGIAVLFANLAILLPIMVFALFAVFAALLILLFRQALVIILVVISPLAFAAIMLPGTKSWYNKWQSVLIQLLLVYPIVALIYAASQIAAEIIRESAANNGHTLIAIFSLGIQMIPLFVTPLLLKFSGNMMNSFSGMMQGMSNAPRRAAMSKARAFELERKQMRNAKLLSGKAFGRQSDTLAAVAKIAPSNVKNAFVTGRRHREADLNNMEKEAIADNMAKYLKNVDDKNLVSSMQAAASAEVYDINMGNIKATIEMFRRNGLSPDDAAAIAMSAKINGRNATETEQRAAAQFAMQNLDTEGARELLALAGNKDNNVPQQVAQDIADEANNRKLSKESFEISQSFLGATRGRDANQEEAMVRGIKSRRLSPAQAPKQDPSTIRQARELLANRPDINQTERHDFAITVARGLVSENVGSGKVQTIDTLGDILNDSLQRGDVTMDEIANAFTEGSQNDKSKAFALLQAKSTADGTLDMQTALNSPAFVDEFNASPNMAETLFNASLASMGSAAQRTNFETLNPETATFFADAIEHGLGKGHLDAVQLEGVHNFVQQVHTTAGTSRMSEAQRRAAAAIVERYNAQVAPGRRIRQ